MIAEFSGGSGRATRAIVDLDRIEANAITLAHHIGPPRQLIAVVKANGYGHGSVMTARAAIAGGATRLAVATVDEGVHLRAAGIREPILVMGPIGNAESSTAIDAGLELTVTSTHEVRAVAAAAHAGPGAAVHLKLDTGMHRYGCNPDEAIAVAEEILGCPGLKLIGTYSHLACADDLDDSASEQQAAQFDRTIVALKSAKLPTGLLHIANSAATLLSSRYHYDAVRVGIALYGLRPDPANSLPPGLSPTLELRSNLARVSTLPAGAGVSYGWTYRAKDDECVGLVPIGYADGYPRALSSRGVMAVRGRSVPVRGRICMDQTVVGLSQVSNVSVGDDILIAGGNGVAPSFDEIALGLGTIAYELVTAIAKRVPRHYHRGGELVAVEDLAGLHEIGKQ